MARESGIKGYTITIDMVQEIIDYIEDNLLENLTPCSIAEHFFISISTMNNLFKTVCSITIMEYVRNRKLSLAGEVLLNSNIPIIELSFQYGYETPEAFTKAFTRFHGYPPSLVRRIYPKVKVFQPLQIKLEIHGGWESTQLKEQSSMLTKECSEEQAENPLSCYDGTIKSKERLDMKNSRNNYHISLEDMQQKEDWRVLLSLAGELAKGNIMFKVDGKTMLFAHGLEFKLDKICLTFNWNEEQRVLDFFGAKEKAESSFGGFKYFDTAFQGMKVRCMFYESQSNYSEESLFQNAEPVEVDGQIIYVQTLKFYYENAKQKDEYYHMVEQYLGKK